MIPEQCVAVSESGLRTHEDLTRLRSAGFDAFLVGEQLMLAPFPGERSFGCVAGRYASASGANAMIRVKICGITNATDASAAIKAGANALGFNFYEKSLRRVSTVDAASRKYSSMKVPESVEVVGVFVNAQPEEINSLRSFVRFDIAQLHGDETPEITTRVAKFVPVIKALARGQQTFLFLLSIEYKNINGISSGCRGRW